jgi:hypothetical protein
MQLRMHVWHVHRETAVAHHQPVLAVEKRKTLLHGLDGVRQVLPRGFRLAHRLGQSTVGIVQQVQRPAKVLCPLTHLVFQQRRALELRIGRA